MINDKKIVVVLPAFNAEKTLEKTYNEIPFDIVDDVILVDDYSNDMTFEIAKNLNIKNTIRHSENKGYGANQKSCYDKAKELKADIVVMLHPDYQYTPKLIHSMCYLIVNDLYDVVLGSRILGNGALSGGMPLYKYFSNRVLTFFQNLLMGQKLSEYHTGYRAFDVKILNRIDYSQNSNDFVFDNQFLSQILYSNFRVSEITCPTKYFEEASSINLKRSIIYGLGVVKVSLTYFMSKQLKFKNKLFKEDINV